MKLSPKAASFVYKNYAMLSWIFVLLLIWSSYVSAQGIYNYIEYGNCNGPDSDGFCLLDPTGENRGTCSVPGINDENITYPVFNPDLPFIGNEDAKITLIEFGCYVCPYTNKAQNTVEKVLEYYEGEVNLQFISYPLPLHDYSYESSMAAKCAEEQGRYAEYHKILFEHSDNFTNQTFIDLAEELNFDSEKFEFCMKNETYKEEIEQDKKLAESAGVKGTPTFFVNQQQIVGPKPFKTFKKIINEELKK